jgi:hypothetical protein
MEIKYNLTGEARKKLVVAVGEILGVAPEYLGAPTFSYVIADFNVDRNGTLTFAGSLDDTISENLLVELVRRGFIHESPDKLVVELPKDGFTDAALSNLVKLVKSKSSLLKKVFKADSLAIEQTEDRLLFPWFDYDSSPEEVKAYTRFVFALCVMAKTLNRVNAMPKDVDNEKYAFRCFLLRLGFVGADFKSERKILLQNLTGNAAFKGGHSEDME